MKGEQLYQYIDDVVATDVEGMAEEM